MYLTPLAGRWQSGGLTLWGSATIMSSSSDDSATSRAVFALCELLALMFGLPPGEALLRGDDIDLRMAVFIFLGLFFAVLGPVWPTMRKKFPNQALLASIGRVSSDFRWWTVVLLAFFLYGSKTLAHLIDRSVLIGWLIFGFPGVALIIMAAFTMKCFSKARPKSSNASREIGSPILTTLAMHVCKIMVRGDAIHSDPRLDIDITIYNGEIDDLSIGQISGKILFNNLNKEFPDSPVLILSDNTNKLSVPEFTLTLRQWMPQEFATRLREAFENEEAVILTFQSLTIPVYKNDQPHIKFRMPIWDGIRIARSNAVVGKVISIASASSIAQRISAA